MKVFELTAPGLEHLRAAERPDPTPGPGEVLIKLRGASLNFLDWLVVQGMRPGLDFPIIPIADGAGEIVAVGSGVTDKKVGDRVMGHLYPYWSAGSVTAQAMQGARGITLPGSLTEYTVLPASGVVASPAHLSDIEAATLPVAATTAWNAVKAGNVRPGTTVLLLGTGGVSLFALQLAKAAGARVIITSSSDDKLERARQLGADETINYRNQPEWDAEVLRLTNGRGVDLVLETVGGATFQRSLNAVSVGGTVFIIGLVSGFELKLNTLPIITKAIRVQGNNTGSVMDLAEAARAIEAHGLRPVVEQRFDWRETRTALETLASGTHFGKIGIAIEA